MMLVRPTLLLGALLAALGTSPTAAQTTSLRTAMRVKLENAQRLLEPLLTADFSRIDQYAEQLSRITNTEISSWQARPESGYIRQATAFLQSVQGLREAAKARSIEQASAEYAALVSSCIQCHRYVRTARSVSLTPVNPGQVTPAGAESR